MSIHKKIILFILIGILIVFAGDLLINAFGPVQILRLAGYKKVITVNCYPQWINDEEYYYLEATNYNDGGTRPGFGIMPVPCSFFWGKISNADFLIYKVNINKPNEKKLVKKITERVNFTLPWDKKLLNTETSFRVANSSKKMILIIQIPIGIMGYDYKGYFFNIGGAEVKKEEFYWKWNDSTKISDISFNGNRFMLPEFSKFSIKDIYSNELSEERNGAWKWIGENSSVAYIWGGNQDTLKIYIADEECKGGQVIYELRYNEFRDIKDLLWDAAISEGSSIIFLSKIGVFKKEDGKWQIIKEIRNMPNFYYPAISPNGQRLVGVKDGQTVVTLELKELLK